MDTGTVILLCAGAAAVGALITYFSMKSDGSSIPYSTMYLDAALLQSLINNKNFKSLKLSTTKGPSEYYYLEASINPNDGSIKVDPAMLKIYELKKTFSKGKNITTYELSSSLKQLPELLSFTSTGYFILEPNEYPKDNSYIYYQISAYTRDGESIVSVDADDHGLQINPCPPGVPY